MKIRAKIKLLDELFITLDKEIIIFKHNSGLNCLSKCCDCCKTDDIEATILEFLPAAHYLHKKGLSYYYLDLLEKYLSKENITNNKICIFCIQTFENNENSGCKIYEYRGLICRLFGFSGKVDKYNEVQLVTCQPIKKGFMSEYNDIINNKTKIAKIPIIRNYYMQLYGIDYNLSNKMYPINKAIKLAIEIVVFSDYYKKAS